MFWNSQNETSEVGDTGPVPPHLSISWVAPTTSLVETREEASLGPLSLHSGWNNLLPWLWNLSCPMCWKSPGLNLCSLSWIAVWFPQASCMPALLSLPLKNPVSRGSHFLHYSCHIPHSSLASWNQHEAYALIFAFHAIPLHASNIYFHW